MKSHFIAYLDMDPENARLSGAKQDIYRDPVKRVLALEQLRNQFGWPEFSEPEFTSLRHTIKGEGEKDAIVRSACYFEIPPPLAKEKQEKQREWISALLKLRSEQDNIKFDIVPGKGRFWAFNVDPYMVTEPLHAPDTNLPMVIPCGDAQIDPDYRLGIGIKSGTERADTLFESMQALDNRQIFINQNQYKFLVNRPMSLHQKELINDYKHKRDSVIDVLERNKALYLKALDKCENPLDKQTIRSGLAEIDYRMGTIYFKKNNIVDAKKCYENSLKLLQTHLPGEHLETVAKNLSNLTLIEKKNKAYDIAIKRADEALAIIPINMAGRDQLIGKINFNKCSCMLELMKAKQNSEMMKKEIDTVKVLVNEMNEKGHPEKEYVTGLSKQVQIIEDKFMLRENKRSLDAA